MEEPRQEHMPGQRSAIYYVIDQLLESVEPLMAEAMRLAAIPRWFDQELLQVLVGNEINAAFVQEELAYFLVGRMLDQDRFGFLEQARAYLLDEWRHEHPQEFEAANRTALAYFATQADHASPVERQIFEQEILYHLLVVDEQAGLDFLSIHFEDAATYDQRDRVEGLVAVVSQLRDQLSEQGIAWLGYFEVRLYRLYERGPAGEARLRALTEQTSDPILKAVAQWSLGNVAVEEQRWSQAIRLYQESLQVLQHAQRTVYVVRVLEALGNAYQDLAGSSSGFQEELNTTTTYTGKVFYVIQHLPFMLYEWLVKRIQFLPNWHGTNYQDWIMAYLLVEAMAWYRRAERAIANASYLVPSTNTYVLAADTQMRTAGDVLGYLHLQLRMAIIEHQLGYWYRARRRFQQLFAAKHIQNSVYRTAQVQAGKGRTLLAEGDLLEAETLLKQAFDTFRHFYDDRSIGETAALLGRAHTALNRQDDAIAVYAAGLKAFDAVREPIGKTHIAWALEDLPHRFALSDIDRQRIRELVSSVQERHYVARFPENMLRRFRRLAVFAALPLTYALTLFIAAAFFILVWFIETQIIVDWPIYQYALANILVSIATAIVPILLGLWVYRLIYVLTGIGLVRVLGRRLIPIERDQPTQFITYPTGLNLMPGSGEGNRNVDWSQITTYATADYYRLHRPIRLLSRTVVGTRAQLLIVIDAITAGYDYLKRDIVRHLRREHQQLEWFHLDFGFFDRIWMTIIGMLALIVGITQPIKTTAQHVTSSEKYYLAFTPVVLSALLALLLLFPTITCWRLLLHRLQFRRVVGYALPSIVPQWLLWIATAVFSIVLVAWLVYRSQST